MMFEILFLWISDEISLFVVISYSIVSHVRFTISYIFRGKDSFLILIRTLLSIYDQFLWTTSIYFLQFTLQILFIWIFCTGLNLESWQYLDVRVIFDIFWRLMFEDLVFSIHMENSKALVSETYWNLRVGAYSE